MGNKLWVHKLHNSKQTLHRSAWCATCKVGTGVLQVIVSVQSPMSVPPSSVTYCTMLYMQGHIIPGEGDLSTDLPDNMKGTIEDVAASPNDPLFIVHHTMVDCVLEEWLRLHSDAEYPTDPIIRDGHRRDDYVRGFFPLYTNGELFKGTEEFGYSCTLPNITLNTTTTDAPDSAPGAHAALFTWPLVVVLALLMTVFQ